MTRVQRSKLSLLARPPSHTPGIRHGKPLLSERTGEIRLLMDIGTRSFIGVLAAVSRCVRPGMPALEKYYNVETDQ